LNVSLGIYGASSTSERPAPIFGSLQHQIGQEVRHRWFFWDRLGEGGKEELREGGGQDGWDGRREGRWEEGWARRQYGWSGTEGRNEGGKMGRREEGGWRETWSS
jgi:hypothetical protein